MDDVAREFATKARQAIAENVRQSEIFKRIRSYALYHYVAALEGRAVRASLEESLGAGYAEHRVAVETSSKVLRAAYAHCPEDDETPVRFSLHAYKEAEALIEYVAKLDTIEYAFELSEKGHFQIDVDTRNSRIKFQYADSKADKADTSLRAREIEMVLSGERGQPDDERLTQAISRIYEVLRPSVLVTGHESCTYKYSDALIDALHEYSAVRVQTVPEEMDASVLVQGFSFAELRSFWGALLALSDGHMMAHWIAVRDMKVKFPGRTMVFHKPRKQLEGLISQISHLSPETVRQLLSLHLYDPHLAYMGPVLQPLLSLNSSEVCLPFLLLTGSNFERNFFKLLRRHPSLTRFADAVEAHKEPIAIKSLTELFPGGRFRRRNNIKILDITDIDFVVYEVATGFVLLIQHKWLVPPETVDESSANDERLAIGIRQAIDSRKYVIEHPEFLHQRLDLDDSDAISRIEAAVVCRGFEHTGFFDDKGIPVIMEVAFKELVQNSENLPTLWGRICARPDRDIAAAKVIDFERSIHLAGYEFVVPTLGRMKS